MLSEFHNQQYPELYRLQHLVELNPVEPNVRYQLAEALFEREDYIAAKHHLQVANQIWPVNANAFALLGSIFESDGDSAEALVAYRKAVELDPKNSKFHFRLAHLLAARNETQSAIISYRRALLLDPSNVDMLRALADIYKTLNEFDKAAAFELKISDLGST